MIFHLYYSIIKLKSRLFLQQKAVFMKEFIPVLKKTRMFAGVSEEEISMMLSCLGARDRKYKKGEYVFREGEHINTIAVPVTGKLHIQSDDYWGKRTILGEVVAGGIFGEAYAASDGGAILNDVIAVEDSIVIFFDVKRVLTTCPSSCRFHSAVVQNMFFAVAEKNRMLVEKLSHMSKRSTREKLMSYLSEEAKKHNTPIFEIPFNRRQLADYLSVDRSAMSNELCKMRDDGLIEFDRNSFKLL